MCSMNPRHYPQTPEFVILYKMNTTRFQTRKTFVETNILWYNCCRSSYFRFSPVDLAHCERNVYYTISLINYNCNYSEMNIVRYSFIIQIEAALLSACSVTSNGERTLIMNCYLSRISLYHYYYYYLRW